MKNKKQKKICDVCGGTGQVSYFKGVSRFLLTSEECDACAGTGFRFESFGNNSANPNSHLSKKKKKGKKS